MKNLSLLVVLFVAFVLVACGDDSTVKVNESVDQKVLDTVTSTVNTKYQCVGKTVADGLAVYCNGDSIGVIVNGEKGESGEPGEKGERGAQGEEGNKGASGDSCTIVSVDEENVQIQCGEEDSFEVSIADLTALHLSLSGFSQKGPFVPGAKVVAYELLDGKTLIQTGKNFAGEIKSNDGLFDISSITLASQYVILDANGYYLNEVTGKRSNAEISLNAITDLSDRSTANVNLLTHLEFERVKYLVTEKGYTVKKAKKTAEQEILQLFHIDGSDFGYSEDLNIFEEGDGNAALLAVTILLQGDRSVGGLIKMLSDVSEDLKKGTGIQKSTRQELVLTALKKDMDGELVQIRNQVKGWNLGPVPEFEKYVRNFWYTEFGLEKCTADNDGETVDLKKEENGLLGYDLQFVCDGGRWRVAADKEIRSKKYCLAANEEETMEFLKQSFICVGSAWRRTSNGNYGMLFDDRDGRMYNVVRIDTNVWMAENLRYADSIASPSLLHCDDADNTPNIFTHTSAAIDHENELWPDSMSIYGVKYSFTAALDVEYGSYIVEATNVINATNQYKGICPNGWHIPLIEDWFYFIPYVKSRALHAAGVSAGASSSDVYGDDMFGLSLLSDDENFLPGIHPSGKYFDVYVSGDIYTNNRSMSYYKNDDGTTDYSRFGALTSRSHHMRCIKDR